VLHSVDFHDDRLELTICVDGSLTDTIGNDADRSGQAQYAEPHLHLVSMPVSKLRRNRETRLIIAEPRNAKSMAADPAMIRLLTSARLANAAMLAGGEQRLADVAKAQGYTEKYFTLLLRLATLDPSIVQAILDGRLPPSLTRMRLAKITNLPIDWAGQRSAFGFA